MKRKHYLIAILQLLLLLPLAATTQVHLRVSNIDVIAGQPFDLPVYTDSTITGQGIFAYTLTLEYSDYFLNAIDIITDETVSDAFGTPAVYFGNGKVTLAGAGSSPLVGEKGDVFIKIRFNPYPNVWGTAYVGPSGSTISYFNEGSPTLSIQTGQVNISPAPSITISPNSGIVLRGEPLAFSVSGDVTPPYSWQLEDNSIGSIDEAGIFTGSNVGFTKVQVTDNAGLTDQTDQRIEVRGYSLSIPNGLSEWQGATIDIPINTTSLDGLNVNSGNFTLTYNPSVLSPAEIVINGTLLQNYQEPMVNWGEGKVTIAFAGSTPLTGEGTLVYVRFNISSVNTGYSWLSITDAILNEDLQPIIQDGSFTTINFATISLSPNGGTLIAGEEIKINASNGVEPYIWTVSDETAASISEEGNLTALRSGKVYVTATDNVGAKITSNLFDVFDTKVFFPDTAAQEQTAFDIPLFINKFPASQTVSSLEGTIIFDDTYLEFVEVVSENTLTNGWSIATNLSGNSLKLSAASANSIDASGIVGRAPLLKLRFQLKASLLVNYTTYLTINSIMLNEGVPRAILANGSIRAAEAGQNLGVTAITSPLSACTLTATETVSVEITNFGFKSYSSGEEIQVQVQVNSGTPVVETITLSEEFTTGDKIAYTLSQTFDISSAGSYYINASTLIAEDTNPSNDTYQVTVNAWGNPQVIIDDAVSICQDEVHTITIPEGYVSYVWSNGGSTTNSLSVDVPGVYSVTVTDANGCSGTSNQQEVSILPLTTIDTHPQSLEIDEGSTTSLTVSATGQNLTYQWYFNDNPIDNATANTFTVEHALPSNSGNYYCIVTGDCGSVTSETATLTVNPVLFALELIANPQAGGTVTGGGNYYSGTSVEVLASPSENYTFVSWTNELDEVVSNEPTYNFIMPSSNFVLTANFSAEDQFLVSVSVNPTSSGTISGEGLYYAGDQVTLIASANEGFTFANWTDASQNVLGTAEAYTFTMPAEEVIITANFEEIPPQEFTLSLDVNPENAGEVTGGGSYVAGAMVQLTATPNGNYTFADWVDTNGTVISTSSTFEFEMPAANTTLTAQFALANQYQVVVAVNPSGAGEVAGAGFYYAGDQVTLTASANEGFTFASWTDASQNVLGTAEAYTFTMPAEEVIITANFEEVPPQGFTLSLDVNPENAGEVTGGGSYVAGAMVQLTATPNGDYTFIDWVDTNGTVISTSSTFEFEMPAANTTLTAQFALANQYQVVVAVNPSGAGEVAGAGFYYAGDQVTLTASANEGFTFASWTDASQNVLGTAEAYTFTMPAEEVIITANFEEIPPQEFTLTLNVNPENAGEVTGGGSYVAGAMVQLTATPNGDYTFTDWVDTNGTVISTSSTFEFEMPAANTTLTAQFSAPEQYQLTVQANPSEGGTVTGNGLYNQGDNITVTASANTGFSFVKWVNLQGELLSEQPTYSFQMPANNLTISAEFSADIPEYSVTFTVLNQSQEPINQATISIDGLTESITTNSTGNASINLPDGDYTYSVTAQGFDEFQGNFTVNGADLSVNITMTAVGITTSRQLLTNLYPNPFSSSLTIEMVSGAKFVQLFTASGLKVRQVAVDNRSRIEILTHDLSPGIYILTLFLEDGSTLSQKIIKVNN